MALTQEEIVETALAMLREGGLAGLSMRRLADNLGVQAGALYYHVANKQELLVAVAGRVLDGADAAPPSDDPRQAAVDLRGVLLRVRDGAEVVSFALAFRPGSLTPLVDLRRLFADRFAPREAEWAAQTLVHYVLGYVADEQNRLELIRAKVLPDEGAPAGDDRFIFGVDAILRGLAPGRFAPPGGYRSSGTPG